MMPYYVAPAIGDGSHGNGYRPRASTQPGASWIDLDFLGSTVNTRRYILYLPVADNDPLIEFMAETMNDAIPQSVKTKIQNKLNCGTITETTFSAVIGQLMTQPPVNGWKAIRPLRTGVKEVWLGRQQVYVETLAKGSSGFGGMTINCDEVIHRADWSTPKRAREYFLDTLGYIPICGGALPFTDTFTNSDGTGLTTHNASYSNINGSHKIVSNGCTGAEDIACGTRWTGDSFDADQYATATVAALAGGQYIGLCLRGTATDFYVLFLTGSASDAYVERVVSGSENAIESATGPAWSVSDVMRLEMEGTTLRVMRNGAHIGSSPYTDTNIASGSAGVGAFGNNTTARIDNVELGNLAAAPAAVAVKLRPSSLRPAIFTPGLAR